MQDKAVSASILSPEQLRQLKETGRVIIDGQTYIPRMGMKVEKIKADGSRETISEAWEE